MANAYDHEEQELLAELKAWWARYGNALLTVLTAVLVGVAGYNGWRWYQRVHASEAAGSYELLLKAATEKDMKRVDDAAGEILEKFPGTGYAPLAAFMAARVHYDAGDLKNAQAKLQWVVDHAKDVELRDMARLRLANVLIDQNAFAEAHKLLDAEMSGQLAALAADLQGDLYALQGKTAEARSAYKTALDRADAKDPNFKDRVQRKLDGLGAA
jgi:predicted negative regulator of RcsB-dependent stress response